MKPVSYSHHRFPPGIIQHAVRLYFRFTLSYRDIVDLLTQRGVDFSCETARRWVEKLGRQYAKRLRMNRPKPNSTWRIEEVFLKINGKQMYLWRAVDDDGEMLDILLQSRRNKRTAISFLRKGSKRAGSVPEVIVFDRWRPTGAAIRSVAPIAPP